MTQGTRLLVGVSALVSESPTPKRAEESPQKVSEFEAHPQSLHGCA